MQQGSGIKTSIKDIAGLDVIFQGNFPENFFEEHFPDLHKRETLPAVINDDYHDNIVNIIGEAALLAKLEIELIKSLENKENKENKEKFIKAFKDSAVYQKYYGEKGLAARATTAIKNKLNTPKSLLEDTLSPEGFKGSMDAGSVQEINASIEGLKDTIQNGDLTISIKDEKEAIQSIMAAILVEDPRQLGALMVAVDEISDQSGQKKPLMLDLQKEMTPLKSFGAKVLGLIAASIVIIGPPFIVAAIGVSIAGGPIAICAAVAMGFAAVLKYKLADKVESYTIDKVTDAIKKTPQTTSKISKQVQGVYDANKDKIDEAAKVFLSSKNEEKVLKFAGIIKSSQEKGHSRS